MDTGREPLPPPVIAVPPTMPGPLGPARSPVWPTALGVVAIVIGALGALGGVWGIVAPFIMPGMFSYATASSPSGAGGATTAGAPLERGALDVWAAWMASAAAVALAVSIVLLAGGIGVAQRRAWGVRTIRVWAWARIVTALLVVAVNAMMQREQMAAMMQSSGAPAGAPAFLTTGFVATTVVLGLAWAWALPAFVLIWLRLDTVKAEIAGWR